MRRFVRLLGSALLCVTAGCTSLHGFAVGPVAARSEGRTSYGDELRLRAGLGTSDGVDVETLDTGASLRVTERSQSLSADVGPTIAHWFGPATLGLNLATGLGFERYADKLFVDPAFHGAFSGGFVLDESRTRVRPMAIMPDVVDPRVGEPGLGTWRERSCFVRRRRTVLTLELRGGYEPRSTRDPLLTAGVLVGLTFVNEVFSVPPQPEAPVTGPRAGAWALLRDPCAGLEDQRSR